MSSDGRAFQKVAELLASPAAALRPAVFGCSRRAALVGAAAAFAASPPPLPALAGRPEGVNKPELLPSSPTNVIDLQSFYTPGQRAKLDKQLAKLQQDTGIKLRVLCQRFPDTCAAHMLSRCLGSRRVPSDLT